MDDRVIRHLLDLCAVQLSQVHERDAFRGRPHVVAAAKNQIR
jgi:3-dehydroquinate dehydratase